MDSNSNEAKIFECRSKLIDSCLSMGKDFASLQVPTGTDRLALATQIRLNDESVHKITSEKVSIVFILRFG